MTAAEVYLPCDVGRLRVKLGFGDTLSLLEETALQVIGALEADDAGPAAQQRADIRELATLLGLGYRVVLDLVHDLWRAGYLIVDFGSNAIGLSPEVRGRLGAGRLSELAGVETEDREVELMVERLTGYVMPSRGPRAPGDPRLAVRFVGSDLGLADAGQAEINQAIRSWLRLQHAPRSDGDGDTGLAPARGRERRVLSVRSAPDDRGAAGRRWWRLDVQAEINEASDRLIITVVDKRFPADRRERASDRLTRLAEEFPREPFVIRLRAMAEQKLIAPPPLEELIERLAAQVAGGTTVPAGPRGFEHLEWAEESRRIDGMIADRVAHEVDAEFVHGAAEHAAVLARLIDEAQTQLVLVCPWITDHALERITPQLRSAIDRGVQLVIVWGIGYQATLPDSVRNALDSLARRARTVPVVRPQVSANTHAKLVVCDNRAALVTSRNVLSATQERPETGLLLRVAGREDGAAIRDLLSWAQINVPGPVSRSVMREAGRFSARSAERANGAAHHPSRPSELPEAPSEAPDQPDAVAAWVLAWAEHTQELRRALAGRQRPAARTVEDGAHRELLWLALHAARHRVVIASGQLSDEVVTERMIDAIGALLARGVAVTIGYDEHGAERGQEALGALTQLTVSYPGLLHMNPATGHAKVLVWDDDVVVGSYNYLSYSGYGSAGGRHLMRSELSVRLTGAAIANAAATACGEPAEVTGRVSAGLAASAVAAPAFGLPAVITAQRLLAPAAGRRPGELVRAELEGADDPWTVVAALDTLTGQGNTEVLRAAVSYCLAYHSGAADPAAVIRWHRRLVSELVGAGAFVEADILRGADPDDAAMPRLATLAALAGRGQPGSGDALYTAIMQDGLTADEQEALLAVATGELLAAGDGDAHAVMVELAAAVAGPWEDLAELALAYEAAAAGAPIAELMREVAEQRHLTEQVQDGWRRLQAALLEADVVPKNLDGAKKTHAKLFGDAGVFGRLGGVTSRHDFAGLRNVAQFPPRLRADDVAGTLLDDTWRKVAPQSDLLTGRPRQKYVKRLAEVIAAARGLLALDDGAGADQAGGGRHPDLLAASRALAEGYGKLRPELARNTGGLARPAAAAVLADLDALLTGRPVDPGQEDRASGEPGQPRPAAWPGRWRYPELAAAMPGDVDAGRVAQLLLRGLADPRPPSETARWLIEAGEFTAAEALRTEARLSLGDAESLRREISDAQAAARARIRYAADALSRRARRVGLVLPVDINEIAEQAEQRATDAEERLKTIEQDVERAEQNLAGSLGRELATSLATRLAQWPASAEAAENWHQSVRACLDAREFAIARRLLSQDPADALAQDPWTVPLLRPTWPFTPASAETALSWYVGDSASCPPGFASWRPDPADGAGRDLLDAMCAQLSGPGERNAATLGRAFQQLVGAPPYPAEPATASAAGWRGRVYLPDDPRLPQNGLLGRQGVATWTAGPAHPPEPGSAPVLWLVTGLGRPAPPPPATMVVDLPFLFRLVTPVAGTALTAETRLINLVRHLAAQLSAAEFLASAGTVVSEPHLTWLLHLLGVSCDGVVTEAIHDDTAGRRELLIPLLEELLAATPPGRNRYQKADVGALNQVRSSGSWRAEARKRLLAPLASDLTALLLVTAAAAFEGDAFTLDDLRTDIRLAATERQAETVLASAAGLADAARRLGRVIFEEAPGGRWRLPRQGVLDLLATPWLGYDPLAQVRAAIKAEHQHQQDEAARVRAELSEDVIKVIGHLVATRQAAARRAHEFSGPERAWEILDRIAPIYEMYLEAVEPVGPLSLTEVIGDQLRHVEWLNPAIKADLVDEQPSLWVVGNQWLLGQAFQNLFDNVRQEIEATQREFGQLRVTVRAVAAAVGGETRCQVDIEDNGRGMAAEARRCFVAGEVNRTGSGRGTGLLTARLWFERYQGTLEILDRPSPLGGAHVRVALPLLRAPASA